MTLPLTIDRSTSVRFLFYLGIGKIFILFRIVIITEQILRIMKIFKSIGPVAPGGS